MLAFRTAGHRALTPGRAPRPLPLGLSLRPVPRRSFAARPADDLRQQAKSSARSSRSHQIPERLLIYHAGTGRTTFLAMLKVTSLFVGAFFCLVAAPSHARSDRPGAETAGVALCGLLPLAFVAYTTAPFVTHMHIHLPPAARASRAALERFVAALPAATPLTVTTMSFVAKPRYSRLRAADLRPACRRLGLVNYLRDPAAAEPRRWYNLPVVTRFYVQDRAPATARNTPPATRGVVDTWIWHAIRDRVAHKAAANPP